MHTPIVAVDHLRIATPDVATAGSDYGRLLGMAPVFEGSVQGQAAVVFSCGNVHLLLVEDSRGSPGLRELCFRVDDSARLMRRLERLAMGYEVAGAAPLAAIRRSVDQPLLRLASSAARGLGISFVATETGESLLEASAADDRRQVTGLDHIVIASDDAVKTAFLLGARLGLDLRMDRSNPDWGARLMFFRCGDLIVEVFQSLDDGGADGNTDEDAFLGLSWRVADADGARARLHQAGVDVSAVRSGRKPGTRVFSVRDRTSGVATLMLEPARRG